MTPPCHGWQAVVAAAYLAHALLSGRALFLQAAG